MMETEAPYPAHGSHLPALITCMNHFRNRPVVLEQGSGNCSTPVLAAMTRMRGGYLTTIETNPEWTPLRAHDRHMVFTGEPAQWLYYDVAFIDGPTHDRRTLIESLTRIFPWRAKIIVVHDTEARSAATYKLPDIVKTGTGLYCPWHAVRTSVLIDRSVDPDGELHSKLGWLRQKEPCLQAIAMWWPPAEVTQ
jgi:hypothetical protein